MSEKKEDQTASKKLSGFLDKNKKLFWILLVVVIAAVVAFICVEVLGSSSSKKNLEKIDVISFALTDGSSALEESALSEKRNATLVDLEPFTKKGGVAGVRANLLSAELSFQKEDYEAALNYYKAAAAKGKKAYTAPIAYYNMGVCYEKLNNLEAAASSYKKAADNEDYLLNAHAKFSYGRVLETSGKYAEAIAAYNELNDKNPDDNWAKIAKTRVITLKAEGKAE